MDVLLIEPSKELAGLIARGFEQNGLFCEVAHSSQKGIRLADKNTPKAVVLELMMPRHNGMEFIYEFRSHHDWLDVPIFIYSNLSRQESGMNETMQKEMGVEGYFYKPNSSLKDLINAVEPRFAALNN